MADKVLTKTLQIAEGVDMPFIGIGTWQSKPDEIKEIIKGAVLAGCRSFDCSVFYGNESEIGESLEAMFDQGLIKREEIFITSKLWNNSHHAEDVRPACLATLKRLQLSYLDLFLVHFPVAYQRGEKLIPRYDSGRIIFDDVPHMETWKAMECLKEEGLVRAIGLSNFNSVQVQNVLDNCKIKPAVNQIEIHPYLTQEKLVNFCHERNIAVTAYSPFASFNRPEKFKNTLMHYNPLEDPMINQIAQKYSKTPAQVILRWLVQRNLITVPKSANLSRIRQNLELADFELTPEEMASMMALNKNYRVFVDHPTSDGIPSLLESTAPQYPFNTEF